MAGYGQYTLATRLVAPLDDAWTDSPKIVAGRTYRDTGGRVIIAKGDPFLAAAGRSGSDRSHVVQLRDAGFTTVRIITHQVFADLPDAIGWAAVTVATVGYGDRRPRTGPGRALAAMVMIMGLAMLWSLVATLAAMLRGVVRLTRRPEHEMDPSDGARSRASWRKHLDATTMAAVIFGVFGSLLPPLDAVFWFRMRPALVAVGLVLAGLVWIALLTVAVGVYRKGAACAVIAFMWWGLGEAFALYPPVKIPAWWHVQEPSPYAHVLWIVGAVFMLRSYNRAIMQLQERWTRPGRAVRTTRSR
ncbi:hypothetical protein CMK11_18205 [Candidatus Poribacteria bacterium]|nr:hypothetical protein [Candidatus Poribacteria bacterium]